MTLVRRVTVPRQYTRFSFVCKFCDNTFEVTPSRLSKRIPKYCSWKCCMAWKKKRAIKRFWNRVDRGSSCWIWTGRVTNSGYGITCSPQGQHTTAHRRAWELTRGTIPSGMEVCHNCPDGDNRLCCNPDHLWLGTRKENAQDSVNKGTSSRGEHHPHSKLTNEQVKQIRRLREEGQNCTTIAKQFGVSRPVISEICAGKRWKHV